MSPPFLYSALQLGLLGVAPAVFLPIIIRMLEPEALASLMLVQTATGFLSVLVQFGMHIQGPVLVSKALNEESRGRVFFEILAVKAGVLICVTIAMAPVANILAPDHALVMLLFIALPIGFWLNSVWYLQSLGEFRVGAMGALIGTALASVIVVLPHFLHAGSAPIIAAVLSLCMPQLFVGIISFSYAYRFVAKVRPSRREVWLAFKQGAPASLSHLLMLVYLSAGTLIVGWQYDAETISAYAALEKVFNVASVCTVLIYSVPYPKLASIYLRSQTDYWAALLKVLRQYLLVTIVIVLVVLGGRDLLASLYFGSRLAPIAIPDLPLFAVWLATSVFLHAAVGHFSISSEKKQQHLMIAVCLAVTFVVGGALCRIHAGYWVVGMIAGQIVCAWFLYCAFRDFELRRGCD